jgi:hypothetical protein
MRKLTGWGIQRKRRLDRLVRTRARGSVLDRSHVLVGLSMC